MNKLVVLVILLSLTICQISQAVSISLTKIKFQEKSSSFEKFFPIEKRYKQIINDYLGTNTDKSDHIMTYPWHIFQKHLFRISIKSLYRETGTPKNSEKFKFHYKSKYSSLHRVNKCNSIPEPSTFVIFIILCTFMFGLRKKRR